MVVALNTVSVGTCFQIGDGIASPVQKYLLTALTAVAGASVVAYNMVQSRFEELASATMVDTFTPTVTSTPIYTI